MKEQLLLFHFTDPALLSTVQKAMLPLNVHCRVVEESEWDQAVGALAGIAAQVSEDSAAPLSAEMVVLCGMENVTMSKVILALRKAQLKLPYKAILTPTNKDWTARKLFEELCAEHRAMTGEQA